MEAKTELIRSDSTHGTMIQIQATIVGDETDNVFTLPSFALITNEIENITNSLLTTVQQAQAPRASIEFDFELAINADQPEKTRAKGIGTYLPATTDTQSSANLLQNCTVQIFSMEGRSLGMGFFVAPGQIITCAHIIQSTQVENAAITVDWGGQPYQAQIILLLTDPDLALLRIDQTEHSCVSLHEEVKLSARLLSYAYSSEYPNGQSVSLNFEEFSSDGFLKLKGGTRLLGLSGAPLMNLETGRVCGFIHSVDRASSQSVKAVWMKNVFEAFENHRGKLQKRDRQRTSEQAVTRQIERESLPTAEAIALLVKSAPSWLPIIIDTLITSIEDALVEEPTEDDEDKSLRRELLLLKRKEQLLQLDEKQAIRHLELALKNAGERALANFQTKAEQDHYSDLLVVLSEYSSTNDSLRRQAMRLFTLSSTPDFTKLNEVYNHALRNHNQGQVPGEVDPSSYLSSFFDALLAELYIDPLFYDRISDALGIREAEISQRSLPEVVETLRRIYGTLSQSYSVEQFERDVAAYAQFIERSLHFLKLVGIVPKERGNGNRDPELDGIFVPPRITKVAPSAQMPDSLADLFEHTSCMVLLGGSGSGKSTTTRYLAWSHAVANLSNSTTPTNVLLLAGKPLPLWIELRQLNEDQGQRTDYDFISYARVVLLGRAGLDIPHQMFETLLERRLMLVLFDGLDEVPTLDDRRTLVEEIEEFVQRYPGNRFLVTSRPAGYKLAPFSNQVFLDAQIQPFDDEQIRRFLEYWYAHVLRLSPLPPDDQKELEELFTALKVNQGLHALAQNPLFLTVITALHRYERLPDRRILIYDRCADLLLETWARLRGTNIRWQDFKLSKEDQYACVAHLGFVLHERAQNGQEQDDDKASSYTGAVEVSSHFILQEIERFLQQQNLFPSKAEQRAQAKLFLNLIQVEAGLIVERGTNENGEALYGFVHHTLQEYFAAIDVYNRFRDEEGSNVISDFLTDHLYDPHWSEVALLLFEKLKREATSRYLRQILDGKIMSHYSEDANLTQALYFVSNCLREQINVESALAEAVVAQLTNLSKSSPLPSLRIQSLEALASLTRTQQYASITRDALRGLATTTEIPASLEAAQVLLQNSPWGSKEWQLSFEAITRLVQQVNLPFKAAIQAIQMLCQTSPAGSEYQRRAIQMLLQLALTPDLSVEQVSLAAQTLYQVAPVDSLEQQQATQLLLIILKRPDLSFDQMVQVVQALYQASTSNSSEQHQATRVLFALTQRPDLPVEQIIFATQALFRSSPAQSSEQQYATERLIALAQRTDLSIEQSILAAHALYMSSTLGSDERRFAAQLLDSMIQRSDLSIEQIVLVAEAFYQINPASSAEYKLATRVLLTRANLPEVSMDQLKLVIQTISRYVTPSSKEWQEITKQVAESFKLSIDEVIQMAAEQRERVQQFYLTEQMRQALQVHEAVPSYTWQMWLEEGAEEAGSLQIGQALTLTLHLTPDPRPNSQPLRLPLDALELAVFVHAPGFHLIGEHLRTLPVMEGRPLKRSLSVQLLPVASGTQSVRLLVYPGSRHEGLLPVTLTRSFAVQVPRNLPAIPELLDRQAIPPPRPEALLYLSFLEEQGRQQLQLYLTCPLLGLEREALEPALSLTPADVVALREAAARMGTETQEAAPSDLLASLRAFGASLFDLLMPPGHRLRSLYWHLRMLADEQVDPWAWLVVADEWALLPWELLCPYRTLPSGEVWYDAFLGEAFVLAHWIGRQGLTLRAEAPVGGLALDHYHQRPQSLPLWHATLQDESLDGEQQGATALPGHLTLMLPGSSSYGLHVLRYTDPQRHTRITSAQTQNTEHFANEAEAMLYRQRLDFTLRRPVLGLSLLNGQPEPGGLGMPLEQRQTGLEESWALPFLHAGASAVVGPYWPVSEEVDQHFFRAFYAAMRSGAPLGWAVWEGRQQVKQRFADRADWLAYAYFGHPWCQPYAVQAVQGFTLFEAVDHQEGAPFEVGQPYQFRASYRLEAPLWYSGRVRQSQGLARGEEVSVLVAPLTGAEPGIYPLLLSAEGKGEDYQCVVTLQMPPEETTLPVLIRFQQGEDELRSLTLKLKVVRATKGEIGASQTGGM